MRVNFRIPQSAPHLQITADTLVAQDDEELNTLTAGVVKGRKGASMRRALGAQKQDSDVGFDDDDESPDGGAVPADLSRKIMALAREQQDEVTHADFRASSAGGAANSGPSGNAAQIAAARGSIRLGGAAAEEEEGAWASSKGDDFVYDGGDETLGDGMALDGEYVGFEEDEEEAAHLERFMTSQPSERRTLADMIFEKLAEMEAGGGQKGNGGPPGEEEGGLPPKVVAVYKEVGAFLKHYKSGKLPKVFKILPGMPNWEDLLYITRPEEWSAHATLAATRIFASNLDSKRAQRFFFSILLPAVRDDIVDNKKLNFHLYMALKRALIKPDAFYKGFLLPLAQEGNCSLREARIITSVLSKAKVPQPHSAAAMLKLALMKYSGAQSVMIKALVDKKYALPYMVIDAVAEHFMNFTEVEGPLPVIWHQGLLSFAQRYKADLTRAQKEAFKQLMKAHTHRAITREVRRELFSAPCRGEATVAAAAAAATAGNTGFSSAVAPSRRGQRGDTEGDVRIR